MSTTAVIMAAGKGTRFGNRTAEMPKGFIEFKGKPMIERSIENLLSVGIKRIIIGTGYHKEWYERLAEEYPQITTVFSPEYANTNSMETLYVCRHAIGEDDFLLLESDIVYEPKALMSLLDDEHPDIMLASDVIKFQDQYYIGVNLDHTLRRCSTQKGEVEGTCGEVFGELVGVHKISNQFYQEMVEDYEHDRAAKLKRGYEFELEDIATARPIVADLADMYGNIPAMQNHYPHRRNLFVLKHSKLQWYEIDDEKDLEYAEKHLRIN